MEYKKPAIVAENNKNGSFAAGCNKFGGCRGGLQGGKELPGQQCKNCECTQ